MKKITFISSQKSKLVLLTGLLVFVCSFNIYSQTFRFEPTLDNSNSTGALFKVGTTNNLIGLWVNAPTGQSQWGTYPFTPQSNFHIHSNSTSLTSTPLFAVSVIDQSIPPPGRLCGAISTLYSDGTVNYGIDQIGPNSLVNHFTGKIGIGTIPSSGFMLDVNGNINASGDNYFRNGICSGWITLTGQNNTIPVIESKQYGLSFYVKGPCGDCITGTFPLMQLTSSENNAVRMVEVSGLLKTQAFQMTPGAGENKVLVSTESGLGVWTDASLFNYNDNDWLESTKSKAPDPPGPATSLYVNPQYKKVGIGTDEPLQSFHIVNGSILLSREDNQSNEFGSLNGSIRFGEVASKQLPNGEWGIEYYNPDPREYTNGGLNIWKVGNDEHQGSNYNLFLRNDGNVGIGTETPQSKLAVNGKITAKEVEVTLDGFPDYVFNSNYNLRSLKDLENYIQINKHLPEIPSEKEVKEQGVKLGEMNALLVKKVEELSLYIIAMQKDVLSLQKEIDALKKEHGAN